MIINMKQVYVSLGAPSVVQSFVKAITPLEGDFELVSGRHVLDARSLMGVFTLDLSKPIMLKVYNASNDNLDAIAPFLSETEGTEDE